jgi:hypothetical protein
LQDSEEFLKNQYEWNQESWKNEEKLIDELERIFERNVHVDRIREPEYYEPTERMIISAENSRQPLYTEAAELVKKRRDIQEGDKHEIKNLLQNTAITPDDESTLFELYVLFRFIQKLEEIRDDSVTLETIKPNQNEIARFSDDPEMVLYHDQSAGDRNISFDIEESFEEKDKLSRSDRVQKVARTISDNYFNEGYQNFTGRPDVIALEIKDDENNQYEYLIAEVKNSRNKSTIRRGIRDTLEYLAFLQVHPAKQKKHYVHENTDSGLFGYGTKGLLVIRDLEKETQTPEKQSSEMTILQASELENNLESVLKDAFSSLN